MGCFGGIKSLLFGDKEKRNEKKVRKRVKKTREKWESEMAEQLQLDGFQRAPSGVGFHVPLPSRPGSSASRPFSRTTILKVRSTLRNTQSQVELSKEQILQERVSRLGQYDLRREACLARKREAEEAFIDKTRLKLMTKTAIQADATRKVIEDYEARCSTRMSLRGPTPIPRGNCNGGAISSVWSSGSSSPISTGDSQ